MWFNFHHERDWVMWNKHGRRMEIFKQCTGCWGSGGMPRFPIQAQSTLTYPGFRSEKAEQKQAEWNCMPFLYLSSLHHILFGPVVLMELEVCWQDCPLGNGPWETPSPSSSTLHVDLWASPWVNALSWQTWKGIWLGRYPMIMIGGAATSTSSRLLW